jgi:phosphonate transport system substrate-binding protein
MWQRNLLLLICTSVFFGTATAQEVRKAGADKGKASKPSSAREKLVVAMPKTYDKLETMNLWGGYFRHLSSCANVELLNAQGESLVRNLNVDVLPEKELIEALKTGAAQLAQVNPGLVPQLVDAGLPSPFAVPGNKASGQRNSYHLILLTKADSSLNQPKDLVGKKIAHSTPTSNSGNLAPRALFPAIGLTPDKNYEVVFSKGHERSVMGLLNAFWDGAAVASDLYQRMALKGEVKESDFRVIWKSPPFMTETWIMNKGVSPALQARVQKCTFSYKFSPTLQKLLPGNDVFLPINFERDFATVMEVYRKTQVALAAQPPKPVDVKPAEAKPADIKPAEAKPAEAKPVPAEPQGSPATSAVEAKPAKQ